MNPLPPRWNDCSTQPGIEPLVLVDGAMQRDVGARLADRAGDAVSLFSDLPGAAQALGPWLMSPAHAVSLGLDGSGPGMNWLASRCTFGETLVHLRHWLRDGDAAGMQYTRLADGRVLRAAIQVWRPAQLVAFSTPWAGWWLSDRDGRAMPLAIPPLHAMAAVGDASPGWDADQTAALAESGLADALLQSLKPTLRSMPSATSREARHALATTLIAAARQHGYVEPSDLASWVAWGMRCSEDADALRAHPVHAQALRGADLWMALGNAEVVRPSSDSI
ncbi:hypothetical protein C1929_17545 [Stenotrophomonas sp. ZAC14D1_NAIMI4_6]|uniref:DUF4123 domain-containing protein n=1 Tax=Stenotrophomonas maltophilia group TaxID=995085 RepID=UPI0009A1BFC2|nr:MULTISPECIES: DUF4123 domain-containing protein [Stenotrophomonas maltophilia group]AWH38442.1 hypothetical protein C1929_17545 [Stenotrophomonas sp. ZAC14D1_NAIMI4_6]AWH42573.1 hypothetical protein C1927_17545 [Stenotrophomonas sp. ZAC14D1_NAIMI4_1]